jgi:hypothetical protein
MGRYATLVLMALSASLALQAITLRSARGGDGACCCHCFLGGNVLCLQDNECAVCFTSGGSCSTGARAPGGSCGSLPACPCVPTNTPTNTPTSTPTTKTPTFTPTNTPTKTPTNNPDQHSDEYAHQHADGDTHQHPSPAGRRVRYALAVRYRLLCRWRLLQHGMHRPVDALQSDQPGGNLREYHSGRTDAHAVGAAGCLAGTRGLRDAHVAASDAESLTSRCPHAEHASLRAVYVGRSCRSAPFVALTRQSPAVQPRGFSAGPGGGKARWHCDRVVRACC